MSENKKNPSAHSRLRKIKTWCCRAFGFVPYDRQSFIEVLERYSRQGLFDPNSIAMLQGVFHVNEMRVRDIMIPRTQAKMIARNASYGEIMNLFIASSHSRFPVLDEKREKIEGVLLAKDLLRYSQAEVASDFNIGEYLRQAFIVPESKRLNVLLEEFKRSRNHLAIVVDEYGSVAGLVTIEDVLEQIVGDITDEHDVAEDSYILSHDNNKFLVKAITPIEDFNRYFRSQVEGGSADTIGGAVIRALGYLPKNGEQIRMGRFLFEVVRADNRRVHLFRVRK